MPIAGNLNSGYDLGSMMNRTIDFLFLIDNGMECEAYRQKIPSLCLCLEKAFEDIMKKMRFRLSEVRAKVIPYGGASIADSPWRDLPLEEEEFREDLLSLKFGEGASSLSATDALYHALQCDYRKQMPSRQVFVFLSFRKGNSFQGREHSLNEVIEAYWSPASQGSLRCLCGYHKRLISFASDHSFLELLEDSLYGVSKADVDNIIKEDGSLNEKAIASLVSDISFSFACN